MMDYKDIVEALLGLPEQISDVEQNLVGMKQAQKMDKQLLERREIEILTSRSDWGKNDKERKVNQEAAFVADGQWRDLNASIITADATIALEETELSRLKNLFYAYRSVSELTAAFMLGDRSVVSAANGQAVIDATADEIGL